MLLFQQRDGVGGDVRQLQTDTCAVTHHKAGHEPRDSVHQIGSATDSICGRGVQFEIRRITQLLETQIPAGFGAA